MAAVQVKHAGKETENTQKKPQNKQLKEKLKIHERGKKINPQVSAKSSLCGITVNVYCAIID